MEMEGLSFQEEQKPPESVETRGAVFLIEALKAAGLDAEAIEKLKPFPPLHGNLVRAFEAMPKDALHQDFSRVILLRLLQSHLQKRNEPSNMVAVLGRYINSFPSSVRAEAAIFGQRTSRKKSGEPTRSSSTAFLRREEIFRRLDDELRVLAPRQEIASSHVPMEIQEADRVAVGMLRSEFDARRLREVESGHTAEMLMMKIMTERDWFGATFERASEYDDYKNGVDGIIEWVDEDGSLVHLAFDFTIIRDKPEYKLAKLQKGVQVKYYRSPADGSDEILNSVPLVVLGVDSRLMETLGRSYLDPSKRFEEHPLQILFLEQAIAQIGLQIRLVAAKLVEAYQNRTSAREVWNVRSAVNVYTKQITERKDLDPADIVGWFSDVSTDELRKVIQNEDNVLRWTQLLAAYRILEKRRKLVDHKEREAAGKLTNQQKIQRAYSQFQPTAS